MAVPKRKTSKSKRDMRSANKGLVATQFTLNSDGSSRLPHMIDQNGMYKGRNYLKFIKRPRKNKQDENSSSSS